MKHDRENLTKPFNAEAIEASIYRQWEESGYFNPDNLKNTIGEPFTVILPPTIVCSSSYSGFVTSNLHNRRFSKLLY
jgi:valyl-tRNA synthetase